MKANKKDTVLLIDDEPQYLDWLVGYLEGKGFVAHTVTTLDEAIERLKKSKYRIVICDLSIPLSENLAKTICSAAPVYAKYPGAYAAYTARNQGHRSKQVVVYSVHEAPEVIELANRVDFQYITKGRPRQFKQEIDNILSYDPTDES
jgi:CheY-like chemotaxis protein